MSCTLRIAGEDFDVDDFILRSQVIPYKVFYKGAPKFETIPDGKKLDNSGCALNVSNADFNDFNNQVADAIDYLNQNYSKLKFIKTTLTIQYAVMDFGVNVDSNMFTRTHHFPTDLLQLVAHLGISIELSTYQASE